MGREHEYAARLFLAWLNERYGRAFTPDRVDGPLVEATDAEAGRVAVYVASLSEDNEAWDARRRELETRLDSARPGSYVLWVPPGGDLPEEEPEESEWVRRVVLGASRLASGRSGEVRLAVRLMLGKVRDEGGYASVAGGLGRYWTTIAGHLEGSYYLDSRGLNRFTREETEREQLYEHIGLVGQGLKTGDAVEFEHEDAWSVQRLARGPASEGLTDGWAIAGSPPGFDPADGGAIRRLLRARLTAAKDALAGVEGAARMLVLVGGYDYIENENAGPALRGFDPATTAPFDAIGLVNDSEVKALLLSRRLSFVTTGAANA